MIDINYYIYKMFIRCFIYLYHLLPSMSFQKSIPYHHQNMFKLLPRSIRGHSFPRRSYSFSSSLLFSSSNNNIPTINQTQSIPQTISDNSPKNQGDWDQWEFGSFTKKLNHQNHIKKSKHSISIQESDDQLYSTSQRFILDTFNSEEIEKAIEILSPFVSNERLDKINHILNQRTDQVTMVFENPSNLNNVWAALRTFDTYGIQNIDIIMTPSYYENSESFAGKMTEAMGSQKWLTIRQFTSIQEYVTMLKEQNYVILASDLHETKSQSINQVNWEQLLSSTLISQEINASKVDSSENLSTTKSTLPAIPQRRKIALIMGNELRGISSEARELADLLVFIPMKGFVESLNLSVACATFCAIFEHKQLLEPHLPASIKRLIYLTWLARSIRGSLKILKHHKLPIESPGSTLYPRIKGISPKP